MSYEPETRSPQPYHREWRGTVYPDGEFSFCRQRKFKLQEHARFNNRGFQKEWVERMVRMHGVCETIRAFCEFEATREMSMAQQTLTGRIDLSIVSIFQKKPKGSSGITSKGRRILRNAAYLIEKDYGKGCLSFATLTLPRLSDEGFKRVSADWGRVVESVSAAIRRRLREEGLPTHLFGCTEVQEKRERKHGGIPLHLHLVFVGRHRSGGWAISPAQLRKSWRDAVNNVLAGLKEFPDFRASENITRVRKSCAAYLAKYLSKGVESIDKLRRKWGERELPKQWHTCTRELRQRIDKEKLVPEAYVCEMLVHAVVTKDGDICRYSAVKMIQNGGGVNYLLAGRTQLTTAGRKLVEGLTRERSSLSFAN